MSLSQLIEEAYLNLEEDTKDDQNNEESNPYKNYGVLVGKPYTPNLPMVVPNGAAANQSSWFGKMAGQYKKLPKWAQYGIPAAALAGLGAGAYAFSNDDTPDIDLSGIF